MNRIELDGKRAVVTGGAQGIGRAIAERLLASGAAVALWDRDQALVEATRAQLATLGRVQAVAVDVTDLAAVEGAAKATVAAQGGIDILVNNAGIAGPNHMLWEYPADAWRQVVEIDLNAVFYCCRAVVPLMIAQNYGRIVNVASIAGKEGNASASAYAAAKAGVIALTKALGKELATQDIAVNCITPAAARTRIFDQITQEFVDFMLSKIPRGRFVKVEEIAAMVAWLVSATAVGLLILGYLAVHLAVRLLTSPTLGIDDAEQALLAQRFAWGYQLRQPPLYTWLLLPVIGVVGPNLLALSLVRYLLLGLTFLSMYAVARRWIADRRLAALAVLSYAAIYMFGYYAHHDLTHTTALAAAIAVSFYAFARLVERPSAARYLALGVCFGFGMLAKWNFVMLAAGLPLACLTDRRLRPLVLDPRLLLALAAMALVVAPSALWVLGQEQSVGRAATAVLVDRPGRGFWNALGAGTAALARASLAYPMPFVVLFLLTLGGALWRGRAAAGRPDAYPAVTPGFLGTMIAVILALHWLLIPTLGAVAFTEHWMHPALMILPVFLFALAERGRPPPRALRAYLALLGLTVALALGARIAHYVQGADHCGSCRDLVPFEALADQLRQAGFARGTIVARDMHAAGNLRILFPGSRVIDPGLPSAVPPTDHGQCLVVWRAGDPKATTRRATILRDVARSLGVPATAGWRAGRVEATMTGSATRRYALGYQLLDPGPGECH